MAQEASLGTPLEEARQKAVRAGSNTALLAGIFGVGALGGIERAAAGRAACYIDDRGYTDDLRYMDRRTADQIEHSEEK